MNELQWRQLQELKKPSKVVIPGQGAEYAARETLRYMLTVLALENRLSLHPPFIEDFKGKPCIQWPDGPLDWAITMSLARETPVEKQVVDVDAEYLYDFDTSRHGHYTETDTGQELIWYPCDT